MISKRPRAAALSRHPEELAPVEIMADLEIERPFEEGAGDTLDPDLRHRMISEAAYYLHAQRGYADGYEFDDWLEAEAQVDHVALQREIDGVVEEATRDGERK